MWVLHDALPHFRREAHDYFKTVFSNELIGRNELVSCPKHYPNLTHCDFFLWGLSRL